jgi:RNA polymerase sigma-70 factor (ECF subfamily)
VKRLDVASSDDDLIRAARRGDRRALTALIKRYEETVYRFAFKICRDREKAEEALQDTFISVFKKLSSFDGKSKFSTWLYTIVTNNCLMKRRKRRAQELEDPLEILDHPPRAADGHFTRQIESWPATPSDVVLDKEMRHVLDQAIQRLPEEYRVVFVLRDVEGRSNEETAGILSISVEATKSRLRRARAFLRNELTPYMSARGDHT